jgi:hypothetical protein
MRLEKAIWLLREIEKGKCSTLADLAQQTCHNNLKLYLRQAERWGLVKLYKNQAESAFSSHF